MAQLIPALIPDSGFAVAPPPTPSADPFSLYDIAIGGIGLLFSNTPQDPMVRETVPPEKQRIDSAKTPGEQTLSAWWIRSQDSFHGGAGQLELEPAFPTPYDEIRFDASKNVDVFTPGQVSRLPDTTALVASDAAMVVGTIVSGADAVAWISPAGALNIITSLTGSPTNAHVTGITDPVLWIETDGPTVYAATATHIYAVNPATPGSARTICAYAATATTGPVIGWVKARLMLGVNGAIYEIDVTQSSVTLGSTQLRYQHPTVGYTWRCFSVSPTAIIAAGDAFGVSSLVQFNVVNVSGAPVLQFQGDIAPLPVGERVLSMVNSQGTFLVLGTTHGIRVGTFDTYTGALTYGPLELSATDPVIPAVAMCGRDRFVYAAGLAYDEGGLIRVDLGTTVDNAGRRAWASDLIAPAFTATAATGVCTLPISGSIVMCIPGSGVLLEGLTAGTGREAWLRTSRIRFNTTEPKIFKLGRVRGDLTSGEINVKSQTALTEIQNLITVGFSTVDPDEFRLVPGPTEWMNMTLTMTGQDTALTSYQVKALPGTRRQRHLQFVCAIADSETGKTGQRIRESQSGRGRLAALEELDAEGDEVVLQEFTPTGVISTRVVIESLSFRQVGRPTSRSDLGGDVTILLRTVES